MSDYLSTLAARSLSLVPVAAPRLTSWYEPASAAMGTTSLPTGPLVEPVLDRPPRATGLPVTGEAPRTRETPTAPPMTAAPHARPRPAEDPAVGRPRVEGARVADRITAASPATNPAAPANATPPPVVVPAARAPRSEQEPAPASARARDAESDARTDSRAPQTFGLADVVRRLTEDRLTALERSRGADVVRAQPAVDPREPATPAVRPPAALEPRPVSAAVRAASDTPVGDTQLPAVRITIGRIEVRAVMPQPPAPVTRPVSPSIPGGTSRDEYLKQRSGAGR